jgi:hypothetical protein
LLNQTGFYLSVRVHYTDAKPLYERALAIREKTLGSKHPDTLRTRAEIARWTGEAGNAREALRLHEELLPIQATELLPQHRDVLRTRNDLAHWTGHAGDVHKALDLCKALLPDLERELGPNDPDPQPPPTPKFLSRRRRLCMTSKWGVSRQPGHERWHFVRR